MKDLSNKKVVIIATDGFEHSELTQPRDRLSDAGAEVHVAAPEPGVIRGWSHGDWAQSEPVDKTIDQVAPRDYDAVVLPGGQINPDVLRLNDKVITLIQTFWSEGKVVAAICHAPWLLIEAGLVKDRQVTSYPSIRTDVINAGGHWNDHSVVADQGLVTSRNPGDLDQFCDKIGEEILEGRHERREAA